MYKIARIYEPKLLLFICELLCLLLLTFQSVWYFSENDVIFSNSQPRLGTRKINGGRKFSEIKVQKNELYCS